MKTSLLSVACRGGRSVVATLVRSVRFNVAKGPTPHGGTHWYSFRRVIAPLGLVLICCNAASAQDALLPARYIPNSDATVLYQRSAFERWTVALRVNTKTERPSRSVDDATSEAKRWLDAADAAGQTRFVGYARAVLEPWWDAVDANSALRMVRARVNSASHDFTAAIADLRDIVAIEPDNALAWLRLALAHQATGSFEPALDACIRFAQLAPGLLGTTCVGHVESLSGSAEKGYQRISSGLARHRGENASIKSWAHSALADIADRLGGSALSERHYQRALAYTPTDQRVRENYADLLLNTHHSASVRAVLDSSGFSDAALLRVAISAQRQDDDDATELKALLTERLAESRQRGTPQYYLEARFALELDAEPVRAMRFALEAWREERTVQGLRLLYACAIAVQQPVPEHVQRWANEQRIEDVRLTLSPTL